MNKYVYIYNLEQANFYIDKGAIAKHIAINNNTGKTFIMFSTDDTHELYIEWQIRNKNTEKTEMDYQ